MQCSMQACRSVWGPIEQTYCRLYTDLLHVHYFWSKLIQPESLPPADVLAHSLLDSGDLACFTICAWWFVSYHRSSWFLSSESWARSYSVCLWPSMECWRMWYPSTLARCHLQKDLDPQPCQLRPSSASRKLLRNWLSLAKCRKWSLHFQKEHWDYPWRKRQSLEELPSLYSPDDRW